MRRPAQDAAATGDLGDFLHGATARDERVAALRMAAERGRLLGPITPPGC